MLYMSLNQPLLGLWSLVAFCFDAVTWLPSRLHPIWTSSSFRHTVCFYMVSLRVCVCVCVFADRSICRSIDLDIVIHLIKWIQFIYKSSNGHKLVYALWRVTYTRDWLEGAHKDCTSDVWPTRLVLWTEKKKKNSPHFCPRINSVIKPREAQISQHHRLGQGIYQTNNNFTKRFKSVVQSSIDLVGFFRYKI